MHIKVSLEVINHDSYRQKSIFHFPVVVTEGTLISQTFLCVTRSGLYIYTFMLRYKPIYTLLCMFSIALYTELIKFMIKISSLEKQFRPPFTAFSQVGVQDSLCKVSFGQYSHEPYLCKSVGS
jgi:hypothetical protein